MNKDNKEKKICNFPDCELEGDYRAYGMSLSSNYNLRPKPIELLIKGSNIRIIKKRQKHTDLI